MWVCCFTRHCRQVAEIIRTRIRIVRFVPPALRKTIDAARIARPGAHKSASGRSSSLSIDPRCSRSMRLDKNRTNSSHHKRPISAEDFPASNSQRCRIVLVRLRK